MRLNRLTVFCLCVTLLSIAAPTFAQEFRGRINGTVTDNTGAVLPGVTVTASSPALIQPQVQVTGADGGFRFLALPPGAHVSHTTWGLGRVLTSDGENVTLDFPSRSGHKMSFAMATKSLDRLPGDGLRVLAIENVAKLRELAKAGHPEVLVRALRDVGGTATAAQLKPRLDVALPGFEWAQYWKQAKERFKEDSRLDLSEAYRQIYRLGTGTAAEASAISLPQLKPKAPTEGLQLLRRFLKDHPEEEPGRRCGHRHGRDPWPQRGGGADGKTRNHPPEED